MINHAFVSKAAMSSVCTLHPCRLWRRLAKKENKHRWSPQHVQLLWRDWARQSSQVQDQSICMVHIFAGGTNTRVRTPRKWAPWCSFSRMVHKFASEFVRRCTFTRGGTNTLLHRQGQTVDLLSVRGPKKKAEMLVGALPERVEPRN